MWAAKRRGDSATVMLHTFHLHLACLRLVLLLHLSPLLAASDGGCERNDSNRLRESSETSVPALNSCRERAHAQALLQKALVRESSVLPVESVDQRQASTSSSLSLLASQREAKKPKVNSFMGEVKKGKAPQAKKQAVMQADGVSLNEGGYKEIAALKNQREMTQFVKRVAKFLGYKITSEWKLNGVVPYYSGKKAKQSFKALKAELVKTAMKGKQGWAKKVGADALDDEEDDDEDASGLDEEDEDGGIMSLEDEGDVVEKKAKGKKNKKSLTEIVSKPKSNKKALIEKVALIEDADVSELDEEDEDGGIMGSEDEGDFVEKKAKGKKNKKSLTEVVSKPKSNKKALIAMKDADVSELDEEDEDGGIMSSEDEGDFVEKKAKGKKNKKSLTEVVSKPKSNKKAPIEKVASVETESGESGVKRNSQGEIVEITSLEDDELTVEGK